MPARCCVFGIGVQVLGPERRGRDFMQLGGGEHPGRVLVLPVCVFPDADETTAYVPRMKLGQAGEDAPLAGSQELFACDCEVDGRLESSGDTLTR